VDYDILVDDYIDHHNSFISLDTQTWREARRLDTSTHRNRFDERYSYGHPRGKIVKAWDKAYVFLHTTSRVLCLYQ